MRSDEFTRRLCAYARLWEEDGPSSEALALPFRPVADGADNGTPQTLLEGMIDELGDGEVAVPVDSVPPIQRGSMHYE